MVALFRHAIYEEANRKIIKWRFYTAAYISYCRPVRVCLSRSLSFIFLQNCFLRRFFLCSHDNSWTAALNLMKFCTHMYIDNFQNHVEFQGYRSKVKFTCFVGFLCAWCCGYPRTVLSLEQGL